MSRIALPDDLAATPFTLADGAAAGLRRGRLAGADLHRPTSGVRCAVPLDQTVQRARAFALALPEDCAFSHVTAMPRVPRSTSCEPRPGPGSGAADVVVTEGWSTGSWPTPGVFA